MAETITNQDLIAVHERAGLLRDGTIQLEAQSKATTEEIRRVAHEYRNDLEKKIKISREMEEADVKVCEIRTKAEVQKLREAIYGEKSSVGPIRKLPAEMLSYIFRYHVDLDSSPWILVKVSKYWMQTGMTTPQLWRYLLIVDPGLASQWGQYVVNGKTQRSFGNKQVCSDAAEMQVALRRSGAVLLTIKIEQNNWRKDAALSQLIPQILSTPICERIQELDIGCHLLGQYLTRDLSFGSFAHLERIRVHLLSEPWTESLLKAISSTGISLETVTFTGSYALDLSEYSFWSHIKRLSLTARDRDGEDGLNSIVTQLGGLEHLDYLPYRWPNENTTLSTWANILHISLSCSVKHLGRLQLPQLETLNFNDTGEILSHLDSGEFPLSYPRLVSLDVNTKSPAWPQYSADAFPMITKFTFRSSMDDQTFISTLESMPTVQNVSLSGCSRPDFGMELLRRLQSHDGTLLCPELKTLELGGQYSMVRTLKGKAGPLVKKLVKSRIGLRKPLSEFTIHWKHRKEVINYASS